MMATAVLVAETFGKVFSPPTRHKSPENSIMDFVSENIASKMLKVEGLFLDLEKEIKTTQFFLQLLRQNSENMVKKLTELTTLPIFLKEYVHINSYLLKYLGFMTEFNCKFEMFQIFEANMKEGENQVKSGETSKIAFTDSNKGYEQIDQNQVLEILKKALTETSSDIVSIKEETALSEIQEKIQESNKQNSEVYKDFAAEKCSSGSNSPVLNDSNICEDIDNKVKTNGEILKSQSTCSLSSHESLSHSEHSNSLNVQTQNELSVKKKSEKVSSSTKYKKKQSPNTSPVEIVPNNPVKTLPVKQKEAMKEVEAQSKVQKKCKMGKEPNISNNKYIQLPSVSCKLSEEIDVLVPYIKSPSEFYVHFKHAELTSGLNELEKKLKSVSVDNKRIYGNNDQKKMIVMNEIGVYALHYSKCDEVWCRAIVTDWCLSFQDDLVCILLLDYGESKCVSVDTLKPLPEVFKQYPAFAIRCHLHGIFPVDMTENCETLVWGKATAEKMRCYVQDSDKVKIKIEPPDQFHPSSSLPVSLWFEEKGTLCCMNQVLLDCEYAIKAFNNDKGFEKVTDSNIDENEVGKTLENWNPMKEDFESYENSYDLNINDPAAHIYGYVGRDYNRICKHFAKTGKCFKGDACVKKHTFLDPCGYTTDQEEIYKNAFNTFSGPDINEKLNIQVTCILGPNKFSCIYDDPCIDQEEENLLSLVQYMNSQNNKRDMRKLVIPPSVGQIVIAQFSEDNSWYRAKILESHPEKDVYTVVFVDYGNKENLTLERIRAIEPKYLHLPFQALRCYIFGIQGNPNVPVSKIREYLNKKLGENNISIEVVSKYPGNDVTLSVNVFDKNGLNIGEDMILKGYAICKNELIVTPDLEVLPG